MGAKVPSATASEAPRYRLFCATWGAFSAESGLGELAQTGANAIALTTALKTLDALSGESVLLHDTAGSSCLDALDEFLASAEDDVILYFASHGLVPSGANQFFRLATGDTRDVEDMMRAFVIAEVIERVSRARPGRKLVIINACYSGKAASSLLSQSPVDLDLPDDICVLFSTDPFTPAKAMSGEALSAFTGGLAEVFVRGLADRGPQLSVRSIYGHFEAAAEGMGMPRPLLISTGNAAERITFRNAARDGHGRDDGFGERVAAFEHRTEILYVDDEESLRDSFRAELERGGHRVTLASGPMEAQDALATGHFDLIVIDVLLQDDVPATEFIQACTTDAPDAQIFLVSRQSEGVSRRTDDTEERWDRLDAIFAYPSRISAFLWKPSYVRTIAQHADRIRAARRHTLTHIQGLDESVALVAERMIARDASLGDKSERLQLEIRVCVERLVERWFPLDSDEYVYIERMEMRPVAGGRSASIVFTLSPSLRGIQAESVTPLVLKLGPAEDIGEEVRRYDRYVQVGVPLDFRTDKINAALVGGIGGVIYSFRGADDNSIGEVSQLGHAEIRQCLEALFGERASKRWYASSGTGDGIAPVDHFTRLGYLPERYKQAVKNLQRSLEKTRVSLPEDSAARAENVESAYESMTRSHKATLVHGDLTLDNLVRINDSRFAIIDYRTVGLGPRLVDFATLEIACWVLARCPETSRAQRFADAHAAIPRSLREPEGDRTVADWLADTCRLARRCRELAVFNHDDATDQEYGALLWLAAVRASEFRSRPVTTEERTAQRALLPAITLAAQAMMGR